MENHQVGRVDFTVRNYYLAQVCLNDGVETERTMSDFISGDDRLTFEGWLSKYQGYNPAMLTADELIMWREAYDEMMERVENTPRVGLMKLRRVTGEHKYAVAIRDGSRLWLTTWVRCSFPKGEIFIMYPRAGSDSGNPHASYHRDGTFHQKLHDRAMLPQQRQPLTAAFKGSEPLGRYQGHGTSTGADCDPNVFDGVVIVEPAILGPRNSSVGIDLVEPGYEETWQRDIAPLFYFGDVVPERNFFP
jgi:hypothetical protein